MANCPLATAHAFAVKEACTAALLLSSSGSRFRLAFSHERSGIVGVSNRGSAFFLPRVAFVGCLIHAEVLRMNLAHSCYREEKAAADNDTHRAGHISDPRLGT